MNPVQIASLLSALAAGVWSVWTWKENQKKDQEIERDRIAALYTNPLLLSMEELQSIIYSILEGDALAVYRKENPDAYEFASPLAIKILYRLSLYFGWSSSVFRFGPYTKDPKVIEFVRKIGHIFGTRKEFPGDAFRFSYDERVSLGHSVVRLLSESAAERPLFESMTFYQFEEEIQKEKNTNGPLYRSKSVRRTIAAIDEADRPEVLEGHERLAVLQNIMVDLLDYFEKMEGFRVSVGDRRKIALEAGYIGNAGIQLEAVEIVHQSRGRIRLRIPRLRTDAAYGTKLYSLLKSAEGVLNIRINPAASSFVISYDADLSSSDFAHAILNAISKQMQKS